MQNYIREKYRHLFDGMETLDNEYYFKVLSKEESEKIENEFFDEEMPKKNIAYIMTGERRSGALEIKMNIKNDVNFDYKVAVFPEVIILLLNAVIDWKERVRILVALPAKTELEGKYLRAHLRRRVPVEGYYGGELIELYPVLIKADTMKKDDFIPLFDMYQEQSFERLFEFMDIYWHKPYNQNVIQELYEKRNPKLFENYEIVDSIWARYLENERELAPNILDIFRYVFRPYKIRFNKQKGEKI